MDMLERRKAKGIRREEGGINISKFIIYTNKIVEN